MIWISFSCSADYCLPQTIIENMEEQKNSTTAQYPNITVPFNRPQPITVPITFNTPVQITPSPILQVKPSVNPKDLLGMKKVSMTKVPATAIAHCAMAMMNGAKKYGPFNWRGNPVVASIYIDACMRHLNAWFDGEECAEDSGVHHLGHAMACLAILLDAQETGNLTDDRPAENQGAFCNLMVKMNETIAHGLSNRPNT